MLCFSLDATEDDGTFGRMMNHSKTNPNVIPKRLTIDNKPRMFFVAKQSIDIGDELLWDYGDRSKKSLLEFPWLNE